jgi:two-component system sensor histidine kinase PilS (NtrC family)
MHRKLIAERLVEMPEDNTSQKRQIRLYFFYRFTLAFGLMISFFAGLGPDFLGATDPKLHSLTVVAYLILTLASLLLSLFNIGSARVEYLFALLVDSIAIATLIYTSGGAGSGLGILLGISIAFASQGMPGNTAMLAATIATVAVFTEASLESVTGVHGQPAYFSSLLLGLSYYALAFLSIELANRARTSEKLIKQQGRDITNLTELNEHVIQQMQTGVVILDKNQNIKMLNDAAWSFLGRPVSAISHPLSEIHPPLAVALDTWRLHPTSQQRHLHAQAEGKDLLVTFQQLGNPGSSGVLIFIDDASHAAAQAQQLKLASLGRLTASIAHEIRNPLGAIGHANQLLRESPDLQGADKRMTEIIDRNTARLNEVIENILSLSRRREPNPELVSIKPWLEKIRMELLENLSMHPNQLMVQVSPEDARLLFDPKQIQQVIHILVENAVKHQDEQGEHLIITLAGGIDRMSREGNLQVIDNGTRIPGDIIDRIFDPFFTTRNTGTGLGLYLAKELCDANNIRISYLPIARGGNCFKLKFQADMVG